MIGVQVLPLNQQLTTRGDDFVVSKSMYDSSHLLSNCSFVGFITQRYLHTCTKL